MLYRVFSNEIGAFSQAFLSPTLTILMKRKKRSRLFASDPREALTADPAFTMKAPSGYKLTRRSGVSSKVVSAYLTPVGKLQRQGSTYVLLT